MADVWCLANWRPATDDKGLATMETEYPSGWTCEVVVVRLERYRLGTLPLGESLAVAEHLEACVVCFQRLTMMEPPSAGARRRG